MLDFKRLETRELARADSARWRGFSAFQCAVLGLGAVALIVMIDAHPDLLFRGLVVFGAVAFALLSAVKLLLAALSARVPTPTASAPTAWPRYSILCALHDEAEVVGQLIENLKRIDYPPDRLEGFLLLEAHDHATRRAAEAARKPDWLQIMIVPPGKPQTKPRALNHALAYATGRPADHL